MENKYDINSILMQSGWYSGRKIDISNMLNWLKQEGYTPCKKVIDFLEEFGLLKISFIDSRFLPESTYICTINIDPTDTGVFKSLIDDYSRHCNTIMIPVAAHPSDCMTICLAENGMFYGGNDDWLITLGDDFREVLFKIISGEKMYPVMVDLD